MNTSRTYLFDLVKLMLIAALIVTLPAGFIHAAQEPGPAASSITGIKVFFKLDPSITRGMYMGDRWVSPSTHYAVKEGAKVVVEVRAHGLDGQGRQVDISPVWEAEDPAMMTISPDKGSKVELTITRPGKSELRVAFGGITKRLPVRAWHQDNAMHVEITQE
jgi:hypothetical protein